MAWPRRRRRFSSDPTEELRNNMLSIQNRAVDALLMPIRLHLKAALEPLINDCVEENQREWAPVHSLLGSLRPKYGQVVMTPYHDKLTLNAHLGYVDSFVFKNTWFNEYGIDSRSINVEVQISHPTLYGESPYPKLGHTIERSSYGNSFYAQLYTPPYTLNGQTPLFSDEAEEDVVNMLRYIQTIYAQFAAWSAQFRHSGRSASSYAAYYSNTVKNWMTELNQHYTPYVRVPNFKLQTPMHPDLNTALSVALTLRGVQTNHLS